MPSNKSFQLSQLALRFGACLKGDDRTITGVAGLEAATPASLVCLRDSQHRSAAVQSGAAAIVTHASLADELPGSVVIAEDPYLTFIRIQQLFLEEPSIYEDHSHVYIHPTAIVSDAASLAPFTYIGAGSSIEANAQLHAGVRVLDNVSIGKGTIIHANTVVHDNSIIGTNCIIGSGTSIGSEGFGYHFAEGMHHKVPQTGSVRIGNNVEIGACVTIDRATFGETVIGNGTKIDNQVQIAHNVQIGEHVIIVAQSGISGSTQIDDHAVLAGRAGVVGHIRIGKGATIGGASVVTKSVPDGEFVTGYPATNHREWKKQVVYLSKLPELVAQMKELINSRYRPVHNKNSDENTGDK